MQRPDIAVVIPTRGRPDVVKRAVFSVLSQTLMPTEVWVVIDGPDPATAEALGAGGDDRVHVLALDTNRGASAARNAGVAAARSEWVAFLDDDDEWLPEKLERQWAVVQRCAARDHTLFATAVEWRVDESSQVYPRRAISPHERVADYLFVRTQPGEGMLAVPTLMLKRALAAAHPLPQGLPTHEEFDWFLQLEAAGAGFEVLLDPVVIVHAPSSRISVSTTSTWHMSLGWALLRRKELGKRAFGAFCLTEVARSAKREGGLALLVGILAMARTGTVRPFEVARFFAIWFVPDALRRRADLGLGRLRRRPATRGAR
ncbi:glycosyltransferase family 2 protein [Geodermatophilus sp. CPCC 206100]|uniref:glycosyltransferase family 2 protein n=1 Tax=Geodermatophilus sp. CPCC 206100 TaxID=3020054 RepID=UPI003B00146D